MFDYQAGEKYKITLIMVAIAGLLAGVFFSVLLMPTPEAPSSRRRAQQTAASTNPDVTGMRMPSPDMAAQQPSLTQAGPSVRPTSPIDAQQLVEQWLPSAWDLSAGTARASQQKAIEYMTPECAHSYQQNIWTPQIAQQIEQSGVQSHFVPKEVTAGGLQGDGSVVVTVVGEQSLGVNGQTRKNRAVRVEYLIKNLPEGLRIAGISEVGGQTQ